MRILAVGDVMGKPGRQCLEEGLAMLGKEFSPEFILVNGENAAGGFGLTEKVYQYFIERLGVSCVTMGNHWHDKREIYDFFPKSNRIVLPANMSNVSDISSGYRILSLPDGRRVAVANLIGKAFMHGENRCPFAAIDGILDRIPETVRIKIVDIHAEATSEKQAMGFYLSGRASLVYGTHSHVPTADERIIDGKTGFITDIGMTGPYDSVIGIRRDAAIQRLRTGVKKNFEPAKDDPWFCAIAVTVDDSTGYCTQIKRYRWSPNSSDKLALQDNNTVL